MTHSKSSPSPRSAWVLLSLRGLFLLGLPLAAGFYGLSDHALLYLTAAWVLPTLLISLPYLAEQRPGAIAWLVSAVDLGLALAMIAATGYDSSPLWWSLLMAPFTLGFVHGMLPAALLAALSATAWGLLSLQAAGWQTNVLPRLGVFSLVILLTSSLLTWLERKGQQALEDRFGTTRASLERIRAEERSRSHDLYRLTADINATLNSEEVINLTLELCYRALAGTGGRTGQIRSAMLLLDQNGFRIAATRHLELGDDRLIFSAESGCVSRALIRGEPQTTLYPEEDPELRQLSGLHDCLSVLVTPLAFSYETYGALIFGHAAPYYFDDEKRELLTAIAQQVTIALQNARIYHELETEKERISELQEESRKKLARDLHDGPTQTIAAITMRVNYARRLMERDFDQASEEMMKLEDMARNTTREIRHMLFTMRPLILETQGLVAALYQLAEKMRDTHHLNVSFETSTDLPEGLDQGRQGVIFYIAEEAMNNARKHAESEHVWVRLKSGEKSFVLQVEDDGVGFNVGAVDAHYAQLGSLGIVSMRERADLVEGTLKIDSAEGDGTRITLSVPLKPIPS
ncbi:MAG: GAF domain-containing sensor histidine kinase [Anaerolineales bacterium]|nr:MAG: GAF domain-containing sensor histidine kinase [Anaerolineales bacterium]